MDAVVILGVGGVVFLLMTVGAWMSIAAASEGSIRPFDYFFLSAVILSFGLANYLWFVTENTKAGMLVAIWVSGNIALALYFRSLFTRSSPNS